MKILKGTSAWINGKLYPEGSSVPKEFENEFSKFLVETDIKYPVPDEQTNDETILVEIPNNKKFKKEKSK